MSIDFGIKIVPLWHDYCNMLTIKDWSFDIEGSFGHRHDNDNDNEMMMIMIIMISPNALYN